MSSAIHSGFLFEELGTEIITFTGRDGTGRYMDELYPNFASSTAWKHLAHAVEARTPVFRRANITSNSEKNYVMSERLILPLASDGRTVDMLLNLTWYLNLSEAMDLEIRSVMLGKSALKSAQPA